jgi:hypothetical protein
MTARSPHRRHISKVDLGRMRKHVRVDESYLDRLASRLAAAARLPVALAQRRVKALAVSARCASESLGSGM